LPAARELELAAATTFQVLEPERRPPPASSTMLLRKASAALDCKLEIHAQDAEALKRTLEIEKSLDEVLKLIREFNAPE
jgi:hypothetical protein